MDLTGPRVQHAPSFASGTSGLLRMPMLDSHQHSRQHWSPRSSSMSQCEEDAKNALEETYEETSNFIVRSRRSILLNDVVCSNLRRLYNPSINHPTSTNDSHSGWKERNRRHVGDAMERSGLMWSQKPSFFSEQIESAKLQFLLILPLLFTLLRDAAVRPVHCVLNHVMLRRVHMIFKDLWISDALSKIFKAEMYLSYTFQGIHSKQKWSHRDAPHTSRKDLLGANKTMWYDAYVPHALLSQIVVPKPVLSDFGDMLWRCWHGCSPGPSGNRAIDKCTVLWSARKWFTSAKWIKTVRLLLRSNNSGLEKKKLITQKKGQNVCQNSWDLCIWTTPVRNKMSTASPQLLGFRTG